MKNYLAALSTTALISVAPFSLAASSTDLTVTGAITPHACTPTLSTANIDFGDIPAKSLNPTAPTPLPEVSLQFAVNCQEPTSMAFNFIDNNPPQGTPFLSLGKTPADEPIGAVMLLFSNPVADTVPVAVSHSNDNGLNWAATLYLQPRYLHAPSVPGNWTVPIASKQFSTGLIARGFINPAQTLTLNEVVPLNGNATLQIEYL